MERAPRVAIAGASGIGKHHAKWFHKSLVFWVAVGKVPLPQSAFYAISFPFRAKAIGT